MTPRFEPQAPAVTESEKEYEYFLTKEAQDVDRLHPDWEDTIIMSTSRSAARERSLTRSPAPLSPRSPWSVQHGQIPKRNPRPPPGPSFRKHSTPAKVSRINHSAANDPDSRPEQRSSSNESFKSCKSWQSATSGRRESTDPKLAPDIQKSEDAVPHTKPKVFSGFKGLSVRPQPKVKIKVLSTPTHSSNPPLAITKATSPTSPRMKRKLHIARDPRQDQHIRTPSTGESSPVTSRPKLAPEKLPGSDLEVIDKSSYDQAGSSSRGHKKRRISSPSAQRRQGEHLTPENVVNLLESEDEEPTPRAIPAKNQSFSSFRSSTSLSSLAPSSQVSYLSASQRLWDGKQEFVTNSSSDGDGLGITPPRPLRDSHLRRQASDHLPDHNSNLPFSSQLSQHSASQRLTTAAGPIVTDSSPPAESLNEDSASDDLSHEESDDDLDDIEMLISRKQQEIAEKDETSATDLGGTDYLDRHSRRRKSTRRSSATYPTPPKSEYRHSLAAMLKKHRKQAAADSRLKKLEDDHSHAEEVYEKLVDSIEPRQMIDTISKLDDPEGKLRQAVDRMNVLEHQTTFKFLRYSTEKAYIPRKQAGPFNVHGWSSIVKLLRRPESLETNLSFISDLCSKQSLPLELQRWCLSELLHDDREAVSNAHIHLLAQCAQHESAPALMTVEVLHDAFLEIGAHVDAKNAAPSKVPFNKGPPPAHAARNLVALLGQISRHLASDVREYAVCYVALLLIDSTFSTSIDPTTVAQTALTSLFASIASTEQEHLFANASNRILKYLNNNPILVSNLVSRVFTSGSEGKAARFTRSLALASLNNAAFTSTVDLERPQTWSLINRILDGPEFSASEIRKTADLTSLGARVSLISTAIGPGFSDFHFLRQHADPQDQTSTDEPPTAAGKISSFFARRQLAPVKSEGEKELNAAARHVAARMRQLASVIFAAHVGKIQCKDRIDGLAFRAELCIATSAGKESYFGSARR